VTANSTSTAISAVTAEVVTAWQGVCYSKGSAATAATVRSFSLARSAVSSGCNKLAHVSFPQANGKARTVEKITAAVTADSERQLRLLILIASDQQRNT
jgi:hypothetical protein